MNVDFDKMDLAELWQFRIQHQLQCPGLGKLISDDARRQQDENFKLEDLVRTPTGRFSFTTHTKDFVAPFRALVKAAYEEGLSNEHPS